ncbi:esterase-like activity of phytase family protein [Skermanella pratensis]|uniref:esterase-like activity of phytase family protein n=1 Tax=Skermanella pratensis TaxID=2233999 RepID=UPI001FE29E5D|nr:esterase-like activity of phytase family protein [Skermanella pratensis]
MSRQKLSHRIIGDAIYGAMAALQDFVRRAFLLASLATLAVVGCSPLTANGPLENSYPVRLDDSRPDRRDVGTLIYRGGLALRDSDPDFGGLSGIVVEPDGRRFVAVSDRGNVVTGNLDYDDAGDLAGVRGITVAPLLDIDGKQAKTNRADSEGLARLPDGRWAVSFERWHRVELYSSHPDGPVTRPLPKLPRPPGIRSAEGNSGPEALAALPDGRMLVIEEGSDDKAGFSRAWLGGAEGWESLSYRGRAPYRPTDATFLPDGDLVVLERRASILGGFGARIVRVPGASIEAGGELSGTELAVLEPPVTTDNFEGISAVSTPDGRTLLYVVSDDNLWGFQRTLLLMFELGA